MPESSDYVYYSIFMLENIYHNFTENGPNSQEIMNFVSIVGSRVPELNWNKVHNFLWIRSTSGRIMISYIL